jgi:hypothetical protein
MKAGSKVHRSLIVALAVFIISLATVALAAPGWVGSMSPAGGSTTYVAVGGTVTVTTQVYQAGVTNAPGQGSGIQCYVYYATVSTWGGIWGLPAYQSMSYASDSVNNDVYSTVLTMPVGGMWEFTTYCTDGNGDTWQQDGNGKLQVGGSGPDAGVPDMAAPDAGVSDATVPDVTVPDQTVITPDVLFGQGTTCTGNSQCQSGYCVDGVCCNGACGGGVVDCQVCKQTMGATADGVCSPMPVNTLCRVAVGTCDVAEVCNGSSMTCPTDAVQSSSYSCRASAGDCDLAEYCDGSTKFCPSNAFRA